VQIAARKNSTIVEIPDDASSSSTILGVERIFGHDVRGHNLGPRGDAVYDSSSLNPRGDAFDGHVNKKGLWDGLRFSKKHNKGHHRSSSSDERRELANAYDKESNRFFHVDDGSGWSLSPPKDVSSDTSGDEFPREFDEFNFRKLPRGGSTSSSSDSSDSSESSEMKNIDKLGLFKLTKRSRNDDDDDDDSSDDSDDDDDDSSDDSDDDDDDDSSDDSDDDDDDSSESRSDDDDDTQWVRVHHFVHDDDDDSRRHNDHRRRHDHSSDDHSHSHRDHHRHHHK